MYIKTAYRILLYIALAIQDICCIAYDRQKDDGGNSRLVGGYDEDIETLNYMAFLQMDDGKKTTFCGGAIISNYSILTAAHCLQGIKTVKVRIGSTYINKGGHRYLYTDFNQHPAFDNTTYDYDIGIVNVKKGMLLDGQKASAIPVASIATDPQEGEFMYISGWGPTEYGGYLSENLQAAKIPVISRKSCSNKIRGITSRMFCAGKGNIRPCKEDYGGPAVGQKYVLNGIASFSVQCSERGYPTVYSNVGHPLIRSYIRSMTGI